MRGQEVIDIVKKAVEDVKAQDQQVVSADALLKYLDALKTDVTISSEASERKFESDLALFHAEHERNLAHYSAQQALNVEMLRSVITYGQEALKAAILINGGAAVAVLAFIGNIWTKGIAAAAVGSITESLVLFAFGVLAATVGTAGSYFCQYFYTEDAQRRALCFHVLTVVVVVVSYILFGLGAYEAYTAFAEHLAPNHLLNQTQKG